MNFLGIHKLFYYLRKRSEWMKEWKRQRETTTEQHCIVGTNSVDEELCVRVGGVLLLLLLLWDYIFVTLVASSGLHFVVGWGSWPLRPLWRHSDGTWCGRTPHRGPLLSLPLSLFLLPLFFLDVDTFCIRWGGFWFLSLFSNSLILPSLRLRVTTAPFE